MPATRLDFSAKSDKTVLGLAWAEFELLRSHELKVRLRCCHPLSSQQSSLFAVGSEAEGTYTLTLGETLPPLSTRTAKINTKWEVPLSCFNIKIGMRNLSSIEGWNCKGLDNKSCIVFCPNSSICHVGNTQPCHFIGKTLPELAGFVA